jgi:cell division septation protein DedD
VQPGEQPPAPPAAAVAAPPPVLTDRRLPCPRCGELAEPGQEVCLRCGALVGRAYRRPPSWRVPAALAALGVLLIGAGAGFGVAELTHNKDKKKKPISLTPRPTAPAAPLPTTTAPTTTAPTTTAPTTTDTTPTTPTTPTGGAGTLTTWPPGKSGWTVLLITTSNKQEAEKTAGNAAKKSISAGILDSNDYKGFQKDSWVAFMGQYDTKAAAKRAAKAYKDKGFSGTPTEIRPKAKTSE